MSDFVLNAEPRSDMGKGASRRLRRSGRVPAIVYGAGKDPVSISLDHNELKHQLENEAFFSHILTVKIGSDEDSTIVKDVQRLPGTPHILHMDLQRVSAKEKIRVHVPLHFLNEAKCPGVKEGGVIAHNLTEVEVQCLPKDLPEYIEVDLANMNLNDTIHMSDLKLPEGAELWELLHGEEHDQAVASIHMPRAAVEVEEAEEAEEAAEAPAPEAKKEEGEGE